MSLSRREEMISIYAAVPRGRCSPSRSCILQAREQLCTSPSIADVVSAGTKAARPGRAKARLQAESVMVPRATQSNTIEIDRNRMQQRRDACEIFELRWDSNFAGIERATEETFGKEDSEAKRYSARAAIQKLQGSNAISATRLFLRIDPGSPQNGQEWSSDSIEWVEKSSVARRMLLRESSGIVREGLLSEAELRKS